MLADRLANEGVANGDKDSRYPWDLLSARKLREDCVTMANEDWGLWMDRADTGDRGGEEIA